MLTCDDLIRIPSWKLSAVEKEFLKLIQIGYV